MATSPTELHPKLETVVRKFLPAETTLTDIRPLTGGATAETWCFNVNDGTEERRYVLRMAHGAEQISTGVDKDTEALVQKAAVDEGVLAAPVRYLLSAEDQLGSGYIMDMIPGETVPQKILRRDEFAPARQLMTRQCGEILSKLHAVPLAKLPALKDLSAEPQLRETLTTYQSFNERSPVFELAFRWLQKHTQANRPKTLVHGDFRNGNLIVDPSEGIRTVLDWELVHVGDPMEDLGWLCVNSWRFGNSDKAVGGFGNREELFAAYEAAGGESVDAEAVKFWEIFGILKWGVICLYQTFSHLDGKEPSVERAAIGRRVSETEIDLIEALS